MAHYLFQCSYTPEAWAAQISNPQNRVKAVAPVLESFGGRFVGAWFAFGEYDIVAICEAPDNISQAAFSLAAYATGHIASVKTTPLMSMEDGVAAMGKADTVAYPGSDWPTWWRE